MKKYLLLIISLSFFIFSCEDHYEKNPEAGYSMANNEVVLKERDHNIPWVRSEYQSKFSSVTNTTKTGVIGIPQVKYLGRSFRNNYYPIEDSRNLGYSVIDFDKFYKDYRSYCNFWKNNTSDGSYFSYANFDRYTSNSTITKNIGGGFKLDVGIFSIGSKSSKKEVFTKSLVENTDAVFGEVNIVVRDSCFELQTSSNILEKIKENYLSKDFKEELYKTHPSEFFSNYGGFVLASFVTGGKASAQYVGLYKKTETSETKEKNMNLEMDASYKFKGAKENSSAELNFGRNSNSSTSVTNEFSSIKMSIKTIGGSPDFASFSIAKEVKNTNLDLSRWVSSLNDKSTHSIIELGDGGLIPITEFIPEFNLRKIMKGYIARGVNKIERLQEPYIKIELGYIYSPIARDALVNLYTRFGDIICLKINTIYPGEFDQYATQEAKRYSAMFGLKMIKNTNTSTSPGSEIIGYGGTTIFKEDLLKKFTYNGVIYIVSDYDPQTDRNDEDCEFCGRFAFSIHDDKILDEYGIRALVNRLPPTNISIETLLRKYRIMAL